MGYIATAAIVGFDSLITDAFRRRKTVVPKKGTDARFDYKWIQFFIHTSQSSATQKISTKNVIISVSSL